MLFSNKTKKKIDDPNQWDTKSNPSDTDYDTYYDDKYYADYGNIKFNYDNSTDTDYYYYADMSDAKKDDKD